MIMTVEILQLADQVSTTLDTRNVEYQRDGYHSHVRWWKYVHYIREIISSFKI